MSAPRPDVWIDLMESDITLALGDDSRRMIYAELADI
jgi:hypothetical protein